jgi:hypothetical protein
LRLSTIFLSSGQSGHRRKKVDIFKEHRMENTVCPVCKTAKPRKDFKRMVTLAQTRAWLRNPLASKRMTYIGKECNECHKQVKRKSKDLTPNELHKRLINEGKNPLVVQAQIAKRRAQGAKKKSAVMSRTMRSWWQERKSSNSNNEER